MELRKIFPWNWNKTRDIYDKQVRKKLDLSNLFNADLEIETNKIIIRNFKNIYIYILLYIMANQEYFSLKHAIDK